MNDLGVSLFNTTFLGFYVSKSEGSIPLTQRMSKLRAAMCG
jgi:hypothetical protein